MGFKGLSWTLRLQLPREGDYYIIYVGDEREGQGRHERETVVIVKLRRAHYTIVVRETGFQGLDKRRNILDVTLQLVFGIS